MKAIIVALTLAVLSTSVSVATESEPLYTVHSKPSATDDYYHNHLKESHSKSPYEAIGRTERHYINSNSVDVNSYELYLELYNEAKESFDAYQSSNSKRTKYYSI